MLMGLVPTVKGTWKSAGGAQLSTKQYSIYALMSHSSAATVDSG